MTAGIEKNEFWRKLWANLPEHVSLPVVRAIVDSLDLVLGVAFGKYEKYAEVSATGLRTVSRTISELHRQGLLRKQARHDGPPVLWLPEIMDMQADEALRRAAWRADHEGENPQNYFTVGDGNVAEGEPARRAREPASDETGYEREPKATITRSPSPSTSTPSELRQQRRAIPKSPAYANDREILRLVYGELDARGLTPEDPKALTIAVHALGTSRPERFRDLDGRALRKAFLRARVRLPEGYDRWVRLIEKWDKVYDRRRARDLVDRLITAVADRPLRILDRLFNSLEQHACHPLKKVRRLELEYNFLKDNQDYFPQLRPSKTDAIKEQVYAALADGPKTIRELARRFGKSDRAISAVGLRLRVEGKITSIWREVEGQFVWARASTAPRFVPARDAIIAALKEGPMTVPVLAQKTGKGKSTVKSALHRHLLHPNGEVIRIKRGTFALAGTEPRYVSKGDAIVAALKRNGSMSFQALVREIGITPLSLPQFLERLREKGAIIRTKRGVYSLPGSAPAYVPTSDAIISALTKKPMKLGHLVQHVNKLTKSARSRGTITTVLSRLVEEGSVKQQQRYGSYSLVRRAHPMSRGVSARRKSKYLVAEPANHQHSTRRAVPSLVHKRGARMVKLRRDSRGNYSSRRCIPDDVRAEYARLYGPRCEVKFSAPARVGSAEARRRFREWDAEIIGRFEAIRDASAAKA